MSIAIETVTSFTRQNTGKHFLDSGFENGRVWQSPAPTRSLTVDSDGWVRVSVTHMLAEHAVQVTDVQEAIETALAEDEDLTWFESGPRVMEARGWVQVARDNTYNTDNEFDQDFVWEVWQRPENVDNRDWIYDTDAIALIYAHTGADARGGYARPLAVRFRGMETSIPTEFTPVCFTPMDEDGENSTYEQDSNQYRLREAYSTFVEWNAGGEVLTLANEDGETRSFAVWARV